MTMTNHLSLSFAPFTTS